jgi:hypothetical protein
MPVQSVRSGLRGPCIILHPGLGAPSPDASSVGENTNLPPIKILSCAHPEADGRPTTRKSDSICNSSSTFPRESIFSSPRRHFRNAEFASWPEMRTTTYANVECRADKGSLGLTLSRCSTSHATPLLCNFQKASWHSSPRRQSLSRLGNCGGDLSSSRSCCKECCGIAG